VPGQQVLAHLLDEVAGVVAHASAATAHEVEGVIRVRQLPVAAPVTELHLPSEPELLEQREGAVDAGEVQVGGLPCGPLVQLLGREMPLGRAQRLPHHPPLRRQAVARFPQSIGHVHERDCARPRPGRLRRMLRINVEAVLDQAVLDEITALIDAVTASEGRRPLGEDKQAQLATGARAWTGVLARRDGALVGYAHMRWNTDGDRPRATVELVVHPGEREEDVGSALLEAVRAVVARAGGGALWAWAHRVEDASATLPAREGLRVQRQLAFMTRPLGDTPPFTLPDGVELRTYQPGEDDQALLAVNNAAFAEHPEQGGWDEETLAERRRLEWFDADDVLLAWQGDELLGFHWTKLHGDSEEAAAEGPVGEVYVLAVHPAAHGLGLGRALLRAGLAHLRARDRALAVLYVDRASAAPLRLYESEGFHAAYDEVCYEQEVPPEQAQPEVAGAESP
jgi:mycothiol synthase